MGQRAIKSGPAQRVTSAVFQPLGRMRAQTVNDAAFTPTTEAGATHIMVQALAQNIRYSIDGGQPATASIGFQLETGEPPVLVPVASPRVFTVFGEASGAILQYQYGWM